MNFHPVANIFPLMEGAEFDALVADIAEHGQREAIWLHPDGSILDGRNRYRACAELGLAPEYRTYTGDTEMASLVSFVVSLNMVRRHMNSGQRAFAALEVERVLAEDAKERQREAGEKYGRGIDSLGKNFPKLSEQTNGKASEQAASIMRTNAHYVTDAKRIASDAPDLAKEVQAGGMSITQAKRELVRRQVADNPPLPQSDKYRVLYADPPWSYGNAGIIGETDNYGHVGRHYPSMSIDELAAMGAQVKAMCEPDAVLFLWVTSPLLEECFPVINAWGFKYKTSFVWDKVRHNFGHYNSVRHEFLLVCVRGSCQPDVQQLFDSVQTIERTEHSVKPKEFRSIIDTIYPHGRRIELFARRAVDGWDNWGNEVD